MKLKFQQLTDHFISHLPSNYQANFYSWIEKGEIVNEGKQVTEQGEILFYLEYQAEFFFHELPFKKINPLKMMELMNEWLNENDEERCMQDVYKTPFELDMLDDSTADLSFSVEFREAIYSNRTAENEQGELDNKTEIWDGEDVSEIEIYVNNQPIDYVEREEKE